MGDVRIWGRLGAQGKIGEIKRFMQQISRKISQWDIKKLENRRKPGQKPPYFLRFCMSHFTHFPQDKQMQNSQIAVLETAYVSIDLLLVQGTLILQGLRTHLSSPPLGDRLMSCPFLTLVMLMWSTHSVIIARTTLQSAECLSATLADEIVG